MRRLIVLLTIPIFISALSSSAYGSTLIAEYLCDLGLKLYQQGELSLALEEFQRALDICPGYEPALRYIKIIQEQISKPALVSEPKVKEISLPRPEEALPPPEELEEFIELAIKNNQPTQIAREEIELAQLKVGEAERTLFPALKLEGYYTDGEVYRVGYEEGEMRVQLDQPIYYGGRLRNTLDQSKVNLEITKRNYDRLRIDVAHKTEVAYYNLLGNYMNLRTQDKIQQESKNRFTVDLTSSYGHYQGRWKTEKMRDSDNWYVGIRATKPWGASTFTTSATTTEVQPKFGQTAPTITNTVTGEFNLLNNLLRLSEKKKAEIDFSRSISDLNETTKTINFEIKDAYLNYQKALLQATTAQSEAEFRLHEVEVLKVRAQVGEIGFSSVMEALINLSRAQTNYTQALANYFISLANLKKAAGYGIKI